MDKKNDKKNKKTTGDVNFNHNPLDFQFEKKDVDNKSQPLTGARSKVEETCNVEAISKSSESDNENNSSRTTYMYIFTKNRARNDF